MYVNECPACGQVCIGDGVGPASRRLIKHYRENRHEDNWHHRLWLNS